MGVVARKLDVGEGEALSLVGRDETVH